MEDKLHSAQTTEENWPVLEVVTIHAMTSNVVLIVVWTASLHFIVGK